MVASVFADAGYVQYRYRPRISNDPGATTSKNTAVFSGFGIGLSWMRPGDYALRLSVAKPTGGTSRSGEKLDKVQTHVQAGMLFN
jgi:hemolysin activation/secretion protein